MVEFHGEIYEVPYAGADASGLGKPLKMMMRPLRAEIPIYLAAIGPEERRARSRDRGRLAPASSSRRTASARSSAALARRARDGFDIAAASTSWSATTSQAARDFLKPLLALYVGGMGARGENFYNELVCRYGYEDEAERIQDLYLEGKQLEAIAAVPDALVDEVCARRPARADRRPARGVARSGSPPSSCDRDLATLGDGGARARVV